MESRRINVTLPAQLIDELDALVPARERSEVIAKATAEYVRKLKVANVVRETAGVWAYEDHPEFATLEDVNRWLEDSRAQWRTSEALEPDNA